MKRLIKIFSWTTPPHYHYARNDNADVYRQCYG